MPRSFDLTAIRLGAIVESSDDAILSKDLGGTILSWNRAAERMFGFTAAEAIGQPITLIVPPDRLREEADVIARISRGEAADHYETVRRRKDGSLIPISLTVSPLRNAEGVVVGASNISRDISDRRRAEQQLASLMDQQRDLQARLVTLVGASSTLFRSPKLDDVLPAAIALAGALLPADGYALWRLDRLTHRWRLGASSGISARFIDRMVATLERLAASTVSFSGALVAEDVAAEPRLSEYLDAYRSEGIQSLLAAPLEVGGELSAALVAYFARPHHFDDVEVQIALALANLTSAAMTTAELYDAQRRIRHEAEYRGRQAQFLAEASAALSSSLDYEATLNRVVRLAVPHVADWCAVDIADDAGTVRRLAAAHVDPGKAELARRLQEHYPDAVEGPVGVRSVIRDGQPLMIRHVTEATLVRIARTPQHLADLKTLQIASFLCVPLVAHGRTLGAITFVNAESGRIYSDDDLAFAQDVAYRSAIAVDNARAYARANAANRAKDEFLATLSHELRTPLNAVLGWVRMLRAGSVSPTKIPRALEVIESNAGAQLRLVEDLLDLSRIITGKFRLDVRPIHLTGAIDAAVAAVQPAASAKNIALTVDADVDAGLVHGDAERLQQAVWNLLSNAIKFTPPGGRVALSLRGVASQVIVEVEDSGEGIAADVLPYVFDRFHQGESGSTRGHMGLGLGLAIVRHIVELHGGHVGVRSEGKGRGAIFTIALPALPSGARPPIDDGPGAGRSIPDALVRAVAGLRVLVLDDDPDARELATELLGEFGVEARAAGSVAAALAEFDSGPIDAVVSDIAMAGQDGFDFLRLLRQSADAARAALPVIALSAFARAEDRERSLAAGFAAHLSKPTGVAELLGAIAGATGRLERAR
ncbi:MAG: PAS domain S-box protein [Acidobacteria bacterium]|nr:PAS domain S-box protein [Acidobacteriota bacterium]